MNKWKVIAPLGLLAAAGAAAALLLKKQAEPDEGKSAPDGKKKAEPGEKMMKTGEYSFVSGFRDAKTVEVLLDYDALRFGFDVIGEDFLSYSSDSHVAVVTGEDFAMQMEYASYYKGEDLPTIADAAEKKYSGFARVSFGGAEGFRYREGDGICFCLGVDDYSYLLLTLLKAQGCDKTIEELADGEDLQELLSTLRVRTKN
ncbi:MAG: hypothetical protein IJQ43_05465 [Oscillospiraceae bacterium]|nr:hypothetical protein [Oscillospiraceae bacterium]